MDSFIFCGRHDEDANFPHCFTDRLISYHNNRNIKKVRTGRNYVLLFCGTCVPGFFKNFFSEVSGVFIPNSAVYN